MFGELPKLFDRNFAIGYFLPITAFITASLNMYSQFNLSFKLLPLFEKDILLNTTFFGLIAWLGGIILLALNRDIYRFLEGYGTLNPFILFAGIEKYRYKNLNKEQSEIKLKLKKLNEEISVVNDEIEKENFENKQEKLQQEIVKAKNKLAKIRQGKAVRFPDNERWLLPTAFGNTIRAFESYSRVMYGLDAIGGWERLLAVIPKDYRTLIDDAKAQTDFWVNLWLLSLLFIFEYLSLCVFTNQYKLFWVLLIAILITFITSIKARISAVEWGSYIKASFDVFLPELYKKLGLRHPLNRYEEREELTKFSQAIIYHSVSSLHSRALLESKENK